MAPTDEEKLKVKDGSTGDRPKKRVNKPLIEKRRRERINECLNQLQNLISQLDKDKYKVGRPAKLEKADILEMTVEFVRKTKSKTPVLHTENSDIQQQSFEAGYRKCMDEIQHFCKENSIPTELKSTLQQQIETKIRQIKTDQAVDLSTKPDKKDTKLTEQLQIIANNAPPIQPKFVPQVSVVNSSTMTQTQNTSVQIFQRPVNAPSSQVAVMCQKEPSTYVLVPAAALCQPLQISSANQGFPIVVQNSAPSYEIKQNISERNGHLYPLANQGQLVMLPNTSFATPIMSSFTNIASAPKPNLSESLSVSSTPYFPVMSTSSSLAGSGKSAVTSFSSISPSSNQLFRSAESQSSSSGQTSQNQNEAQNIDAMWRPW